MGQVAATSTRWVVIQKTVGLETQAVCQSGSISVAGVEDRRFDANTSKHKTDRLRQLSFSDTEIFAAVYSDKSAAAEPMKEDALCRSKAPSMELFSKISVWQDYARVSARLHKLVTPIVAQLSAVTLVFWQVQSIRGSNCVELKSQNLVDFI